MTVPDPASPHDLCRETSRGACTFPVLSTLVERVSRLLPSCLTSSGVFPSTVPLFCTPFGLCSNSFRAFVYTWSTALLRHHTTMKHHLMVGTWTPPGRIYTVVFDDEALTLELVQKTDIPEDEPISWMTFDVCSYFKVSVDGSGLTACSMRRRTSTARP